MLCKRRRRRFSSSPASSRQTNFAASHSSGKPRRRSGAGRSRRQTRSAPSARPHTPLTMRPSGPCSGIESRSRTRQEALSSCRIASAPRKRSENALPPHSGSASAACSSSPAATTGMAPRPAAASGEMRTAGSAPRNVGALQPGGARAPPATHGRSANAAARRRGLQGDLRAGARPTCASRHAARSQPLHGGGVARAHRRSAAQQRRGSARTSMETHQAVAGRLEE